MLFCQTAVGNICNIEYWSGFDESRKQNGGRGGFPFRLKWGHPTEIFILMFDAVSTLEKKEGKKKKHLKKLNLSGGIQLRYSSLSPDSYV